MRHENLEHHLSDAVAHADAIYRIKNAERGSIWADGGLISIITGMSRYYARLNEVGVKRYQYGSDLTSEQVKEFANDFIDLINHARMGYALLCSGRWYPGDDNNSERNEFVMEALDER